MTQQMDTRKSWERLPEETPKAHAAFVMYLQMPPFGDAENKRSLANLAKKLELASTSGVEGWSAKYNWQERAVAYDAFMQTKAITIRETALRDFQQNIVTRMGAQLAVINEVLDRAWKEVNDRQVAGGETDLAALKKLMDATKAKDDLARRMAGLPTQYTTQKAEEQDPEDNVYIIGGSA